MPQSEWILLVTKWTSNYSYIFNARKTDPIPLASLQYNTRSTVLVEIKQIPRIEMHPSFITHSQAHR